MHNFYEEMAPASTTTATKSTCAKTKKKKTKHGRKGREANIQEGAIEQPAVTGHSIAAGRSVAGGSASVGSVACDDSASLGRAAIAGNGNNATVTPCAASRTSNVPATGSTIAESQSYASLKEKIAFDIKCRNWCDAIIRVVGKNLFDCIQFITSPEDEMYGSDFQKLVCSQAGVDKDVAEEFWNRREDGGMMTARKSLNRRRMNTTNAMKKKFMGKY
jgi:hypothetical protein